MSKGKCTAEEKERAIQECSKSSSYAVARKYKTGRTTLREWIAKYESMGFAGLHGAQGCGYAVQKKARSSGGGGVISQHKTGQNDVEQRI